MTPDELAAIGRTLTGGAHGWLSRFSAALRVSDRHLRRLLHGTAPITDGIAADARALLDADRADRWILGSGDRSEGDYLIHLRPPRFIARLVDEDHPGDADTLSGITLSLGEHGLLCEITWLDEPGANLEALAADAATAVRRFETAE